MGNNTSGLSAYEPGQFIGKESVFTADPTYSLVCFVSTKFEMEDRIEAEFKRRYGGVEWLKAQSPVEGKAVPVKVGDRYIYYLTVRKEAFDKATVQNVESALRDLKSHARNNGVRNIAVPHHFTSDFMQSAYKAVFEEVFKGNGRKSITVHYFET